MREIEVGKINAIIETKVTCDRCKKICTNSNYKIMSRACFIDKNDTIEDVCWTCWKKIYGKKINEGIHTKEAVEESNN